MCRKIHGNMPLFGEGKLEPAFERTSSIDIARFLFCLNTFTRETAHLPRTFWISTPDLRRNFSSFFLIECEGDLLLFAPLDLDPRARGFDFFFGWATFVAFDSLLSVMLLFLLRWYRISTAVDQYDRATFV